MLKASRLVPVVSSQLSSRAFLATTAIPSTAADGDLAWDAAKPYSAVPGPNMWQLFNWFRPGGKLFGKQVADIQAEFYKEFGNLSKLPGMFGKPDFLFVYEPEDMEKIYRHEGQYPVRNGLDSVLYYRKNLRQDIYGQDAGLATEQGETWWNFRHKVNPVMMKPKVVKVYVPKLDEISQDFVKKLDQSLLPDGSAPEDMLTLFNKWALESVCYVSLDTRIGLLGDKEMPEAIKLMNCLKLFFEHVYKLDVLPSLWKIYKTPTFKASMKNLDEMTDMALFFLEKGKKALEEKKKSNNQTDRESGVLEKLLEIDQNVALVMTLDSIIAGIDTTTATTFQLLHALALFPEKQEILRKEIKSILPDEDSKLTPENMSNMPYLRACMKESARYDPILGPFRSSGTDMTLQGYQIPQNTACIMAQTIQLRNEKYVEKADQFIPERFLRQTDAEATNCPVKQKEFHPFLFLPFGFGPRMCIGKRFAELEMETVICRLLQKYRVEWDGPEPTYIASLGKIPIGKTYFKFKELK